MNCPRCRGFMEYVRDEDGRYHNCLMCGRRVWEEAVKPLDIPEEYKGRRSKRSAKHHEMRMS